jgi:hypothetical protein
MVPFLYPRKGKSKPQHHLPHSQAFSHSTTKHTRHSQEATTETKVPHSYPDTADLELYTASLHRWTLCQLHTSFPTVPHTLSRHCTSSTTFTQTPTMVSPLYPTNSSLYDCSIRTPGATPGVAGLDGSGDESEEVLGDIGTTPCNTPKQRGLRRRSKVVAAKGGRVRDEVADEGEGQARLGPVELVRSLSCVG